MGNKMFGSVIEANYLTTPKSPIYRMIINCCYRLYEQTRLQIDPTEILEMVRSHKRFENYSSGDLLTDLEQLKDWNNVLIYHDTSRAKNINDLHNKSPRYQLTRETVEIERAIQKIEEIKAGYNKIVEAKIYERLLKNFRNLVSVIRKGEQINYSIELQTDEFVYHLWSRVFDDFIKVTRQANDYLAFLQSKTAEDLLKANVLFKFRDEIIKYLRSFVLEMTDVGTRIEAILLEQINDEFVSILSNKVTTHEMVMGLVEDSETKREQYLSRFFNQWNGFSMWFTDSGNYGGFVHMQNQSSEMISRICRYSLRLSSSLGKVQNQKYYFETLAKWFNDSENMDQCHILSSYVFATFGMQHIWLKTHKQTESTDTSIWEEKPYEFVFYPRENIDSPIKRTQVIKVNTEEQKKIREENQKKNLLQIELIKDMIRDKEIVVGDLSDLNAVARRTLLNLISRCVQNPNGMARLGSNYYFKLERLERESVELVCQDGIFNLPDFVLRLVDKGSEYREEIG